MDNENSVLESALHITRLWEVQAYCLMKVLRRPEVWLFVPKLDSWKFAWGSLIQDCFKLGSSASYRPSFNAILPLPKRPPSVLLLPSSRVLRPWKIYSPTFRSWLSSSFVQFSATSAFLRRQFGCLPKNALVAKTLIMEGRRPNFFWPKLV